VSVYVLLGWYAFFCLVIGLALGYHEERVWLLGVFIVAGVLCLQLGFFAALLLRT
jgi:hypothetical protein